MYADLTSIGGVETLMALMRDPEPSLRWRAAEVAATCAQNNPPVQEWLLKAGCLPKLLRLLEDGEPTCRWDIHLRSPISELAPLVAYTPYHARFMFKTLQCAGPVFYGGCSIYPRLWMGLCCLLGMMLNKIGLALCHSQCPVYIHQNFA